MAQPKFEVVIDRRKLTAAIRRFPIKLRIRAKSAMKQAAEIAAGNIRDQFNGRPFGFKDKTGALRKSIKGDVLRVTGNEVIGFIRAGDDTIGSDGQQTRKYAELIEFGEFSKAGNTAFLRPGVLLEKDTIRNIMTGRLRSLLRGRI